MRSTSSVLWDEEDAALVVTQHVHELGQHLVAGDRVEARGRLVQHQEAWPARQGQQQQGLGLLAGRGL